MLWFAPDIERLLRNGDVSKVLKATHHRNPDVRARAAKALAGFLTGERSIYVERETALCLPLLDMKTASLTIRLDEELDRLLTRASHLSGRNRSEVARDALRRQLRISQFEALRRKIMPFAEARGYLTDEDVFAAVS